MTAQPRRRRDRGSINVDEIINGAFEVAAEVSIDNLSMPLLAKHLDVGVTSIYWYFRRKDDLLDAMADRALERFEFTAPHIDASNWRESLRNHAQTMRKAFRSNPILCDLVLIRGHYGSRALQGALKQIWDVGNRYIGLADDIDFDYILDHAGSLIAERELGVEKSSKLRT